MILDFQGIVTGRLSLELERYDYYEGYLVQNKQSCLLKVLRERFPDPIELGRLNSEIKLYRSLQLASVPVLMDVRANDRGPVLIFENPMARSLSGAMEGLPMPVGQFLQIAISMAKGVDDLHNAQIIHRGLTPRTILLNQDESKVFFLDLSTATRVSRLNRESGKGLYNSLHLPYIAPEQTGRMNRSVDHRCDLYSLGIIFYEMLVGKKPFQATNPIEWAHNHLAKEIPSLPKELSPTLDKIIHRLTAKNVEDRYQSALGLYEDLVHCKNDLREFGEVSPFEIAQRDSKGVLQISEKIYGRDRELGILLDRFYRSTHSALEICHITGTAGVGKTALVAELQKTVSQMQGRFAVGKFDQFEKHSPYRAWILVCRSLMKQVEEEGGVTLRRISERVRKALGDNAGVLTPLLPELGAWVGNTSDPPVLAATESRNRFTELFRAFLEAFTEPERPLAIFLDDIHWADSGSLELLRNIAHSADISYLSVYLSSRSDEDQFNAFSSMKEELSKLGRLVEIDLPPLQKDDVNSMLADTLSVGREKTLILSQILFEQTEGNPLFIGQLMQEWHSEGILFYDHSQRKWKWDDDKLKSLYTGLGIVDFLSKRITSLDPESKRALSAAACFGTWFAYEWLVAICGLNQESLDQALALVLHEGFLKAEENIEDIGSRQIGTETSEYTAFKFSFIHDRLQQAAYEILSPEESSEIHRSIAQYLNHRYAELPTSEILFATVQHYNKALPILRRTSERYEIAALNLVAAKKAKANAVWLTALELSRAGIQCLPENAWVERHELTFDLHTEALDCEYLNGNYAEADILFAQITKEAQDKLQLVQVYQQRVVLFTNKGRHQEGIRLGLDGLSLLGVDLPENPSLPRILLEVIRIRFAKGRKHPTDLLNLPEMTDKRSLIIMDLLMAITPCAFFINQNLFALVALRMALLSLKRGNCKLSSYAYITYGVLIISAFEKQIEGVEWGDLALSLHEKYDNIELTAKLNVIYGSFISHWVNSLGKNAFYLRKAFRSGLENGDLVYAGYALANRVFAVVAHGESLDECSRMATSFLRFAERTGDRDVAGDFQLVLQATKHLKGQTGNVLTFSDSSYDEDSHVKEMKHGNPVTLAFYHLLKMRNLYILGYSNLALSHVRPFSLVAEPTRPLVIEASFLFYQILCLFDKRLTNLLSMKEALAIKRIRKKYLKWRRLAAPHLKARATLILAEFASHRGQFSRALKLYSSAITQFSTDQDTLGRAMAAERTGRFLLRRKVEGAAEHYLQDACYHYDVFGATAKTELLRGEFHFIRSPNHGDDGIANQVDLLSVMRTATAISGERTQDTLLERVLEVIMVQSGARKIAYIHQHNGQLCVAATGQSGALTKVKVVHEIVQDSSLIPLRIVEHVRANHESIVIQDANREERFHDDPYIAARVVKSVLCAPVLLQGKLTGILYLENEIIAGAFTKERLEILSILSAQFAVSLENSILYEDLESKVSERTKALEATLKEVQQLKLNQDLDYYLTALLMQPLSGLRVESDRVELQQFVSQKKKFRYKKWHEQIGGDLSIARSVVVRERPCIAILCADAMGKSMQGAGGALVAGAVFESITAAGIGKEQLTPREWIKQCYTEMNSVFRSFQGYMMLSALIAIVDEESLIAEYINADFPSTVLLRKGSASFLKEVNAPKLGMPAPFAQIPVNECPLESNDVWVIASDGRDDLLIPTVDREEILNEDANLFLKMVEQADGNAEGIHQALTGKGTLSDDLGILCVRAI